jgi:general stress protein YciG
MQTLSEAGKKGGRKRANVLSKERRIEIAKMGGNKRAENDRKRKVKINEILA